MRSLLLLMLVTIVVVSFSDAGWFAKSKKTAECRRSCIRQCNDADDDQDNDNQRPQTNGGNDGKKCRGWLSNRKCRDKQDTDVEEQQPAEIEETGEEDENCKGWIKTMFKKECRRNNAEDKKGGGKKKV
ncbi:uncharacterized protein LOC118403541 [Branchiostoma floridae]|uniref:Uncharacterized protein LOC118403541 n=1 Tax=Branchiostoma floridae TaxID=7739 RepID=A0A9J7KGQ9_BRAFL|nr:uncharacterized protein LOC118403541 [Branchiostoma floridae]